jgi:hypothetical protein
MKQVKGRKGNKKQTEKIVIFDIEQKNKLPCLFFCSISNITLFEAN